MRSVVLTFLLLTGFVMSSAAQSVERVEIRVGQQKTTKVGNLRIKFVRLLEDSRCPINAKCVWAGNAKVRISVKGKRGTRTIELNTGREPRIATYYGYDIRMEDVNPAPIADPKAPKPPPTLTLSIERHK